jgi:hypothetical protein
MSLVNVHANHKINKVYDVFGSVLELQYKGRQD